MALQIGRRPETVKPRRLKMLVSGKPGVGKTWAVTHGFPGLFFIDTENGATEPEYTKALQDAGALYLGVADGSQGAVEVVECMHQLHTQKHDRVTVCIDSITKWFNMQVQAAEEKVGSEYGRDKKEALPWLRRLISYMDVIDMNVILIAHSKVDYKDGERCGTTFDCWDKLEYELDMWLEVTREGSKHVATVRKSRVAAFPLGHRIPWNFESVADLYGRSDVVKESKAVKHTDVLKQLVTEHKVPTDIVEKWLKKAKVDAIENLNESQTKLCIEWINDNQMAA